MAVNGWKHRYPELHGGGAGFLSIGGLTGVLPFRVGGGGAVGGEFPQIGLREDGTGIMRYGRALSRWPTGRGWEVGPEISGQPAEAFDAALDEALYAGKSAETLPA